MVASKTLLIAPRSADDRTLFAPLGEGIAQNLQLIPVAFGLWVWIIAHYVYDVRLVLPVIIERGLGVLFGSPAVRSDANA
jgi:hypothetical protein